MLLQDSMTMVSAGTLMPKTSELVRSAQRRLVMEWALALIHQSVQTALPRIRFRISTWVPHLADQSLSLKVAMSTLPQASMMTESDGTRMSSHSESERSVQRNPVRAWDLVLMTQIELMHRRSLRFQTSTWDPLPAAHSPLPKVET